MFKIKCLLLNIISLILLVSVLFLMPDTVLASENSGAAIFEANCAGCHAKGGNIIRRGKNLKEKTLKHNHLDTVDGISSLVRKGKNNMPAYEDRLELSEIETVSHYVLEQAAKNWRN